MTISSPLRLETAGAVCLLIAVYHLRPQPRLIMRAGLICALMKALSLGHHPRTYGGHSYGISFVGRNDKATRGQSLGYMIGGTLALSWSLAHKLASLLSSTAPTCWISI